MKVAIVITNYNYSDTVVRSIETAFSQQYKADVWVCDDGSVDNSYEVLCQCKEDYPELFNYFSKDNDHLGPSRLKNWMIKEILCKDEYNLIVFQDADDYASPLMVSEYVKCLSRYPNRISIMYTDEYVEDKINDTNYTVYKPPFDLTLFCMNDYIGGNLAINTLAFKQFGLFDENMPVAEFYDFALRCGENSSIVHIPKPLLTTRYTTRCLRNKVGQDEWSKWRTYALEKANKRINEKTKML